MHIRPKLINTLFGTDGNAAEGLVTGKVDASFAVDPPVGYYVETSVGKFEATAVRSRQLPTASRPTVKRACSQPYADRVLMAILAKWGLNAFVFTG